MYKSVYSGHFRVTQYVYRDTVYIKIYDGYNDFCITFLEGVLDIVLDMFNAIDKRKESVNTSGLLSKMGYDNLLGKDIIESNWIRTARVDKTLNVLNKFLEENCIVELDSEKILDELETYDLSKLIQVVKRIEHKKEKEKKND